MLRETWTGAELQSGGCAVEEGGVHLGDCGVHLPKPVLGKGLKGESVYLGRTRAGGAVGPGECGG